MSDEVHSDMAIMCMSRCKNWEDEKVFLRTMINGMRPQGWNRFGSLLSDDELVHLLGVTSELMAYGKDKAGILGLNKDLLPDGLYGRGFDGYD